MANEVPITKIKLCLHSFYVYFIAKYKKSYNPLILNNKKNNIKINHLTLNLIIYNNWITLHNHVINKKNLIANQYFRVILTSREKANIFIRDLTIFIFLIWSR